MNYIALIKKVSSKFNIIIKSVFLFPILTVPFFQENVDYFLDTLKTPHTNACFTKNWNRKLTIMLREAMFSD